MPRTRLELAKRRPEDFTGVVISLDCMRSGRPASRTVVPRWRARVNGVRGEGMRQKELSHAIKS